MNETFADDVYVSNLTLEHCQIQFSNQTAQLLESHPGDFCSVTFDSVLCWPPTPVNKTAVIKCFAELFSIKYDDTRE